MRQDVTEAFRTLSRELVRFAELPEPCFVPLVAVDVRRRRCGNNPQLEPLDLFVVHSSPSQMFLSNFRRRILRARTTLYLNMLRKEGDPYKTTPSKCGRFHLWGHDASVMPAIEFQEEDILNVIRRQMPAVDTMSVLDFEQETEDGVVALLPIPGPSAGWQLYPGWIAFLKPLSDPSMLRTRNAFSNWLDGSEKWLEKPHSALNAVDIARRLGYSDVAKILSLHYNLREACK